MFGWFRVEGDSMLPTLVSGQRLLTIRIPDRLIKPGMLAVVRTHAGDVVKRIAHIDASSVMLTSDNSATTSQFTEQLISINALVGVVVWPRLRPDAPTES
ncbi:MAG: S24 family peptidase [Pseudomonadota bacterium]